MIIVNINGGLGNQMFQYAFGKALSIRHQQPLALSADFFSKKSIHNGYELGRVFNLDAPLVNSKTIKKTIGMVRSSVFARKWLAKPYLTGLSGKRLCMEPRIYYSPSVIEELGEKKYFQGYWQSYHYFEAYHHQIREAFGFSLPLDEKNDQLVQKIQSTTSVSLHLRRGDYLHNKKALNFHGICPIDFYLKALAFIKQKNTQFELFVFSDDAEYAYHAFKSHMPSSIIVAHNKGLDSWKDMYLMSLCKHNIIANSTFSWWSAWLNANPEKKVIAPIAWFKAALTSKDLIPADWVRL